MYLRKDGTGGGGLYNVGLIFHGQNCCYYFQGSKFPYAKDAMEFVYDSSTFGLYSCGNQAHLLKKLFEISFRLYLQVMLIADPGWKE
jgi:hypothetical protein